MIQTFESKEKPTLTNYYNYYKGTQAIMSKQATDVGKPCNKIVSNYCYNIVQNYSGYLTGVNIAYHSPIDISEIIKVLNYNDYKSEDTELLRQALIYGRAFEVAYIDLDSQIRFKLFDTRECIPVYDTTIDENLKYVIRYYKINMYNDKDEYFVEVYSDEKTDYYKSQAGYGALTLLSSEPNYFNQVPVTVFSLNKEEESIFDKVMTLQDAYNKLISSEVDDFEAFCDSYLVLKNCYAEPEDIQKMKENRVLLLGDGADAMYLTKNISDTQIENMLTKINDTIHKIANSPDFNDEKLLAQSGIAMRYKLVGFENNASAIEGQMKKALQKRIELICEVLHLTGTDEDWRDIEIIFTRNLPVNVVEIAQVVNQLRGIVSDETLLAQIPFISDATAEYEKVKEQKETNISLYSFGNETTTETEEEDISNG